jgi:hypothetical protein
MHTARTIAAAALTVLLAAATNSPATAEPAQTFGGGLAITDGVAGFVVDVNADGRFDLKFAYYGTSVNSIFGWDAIVNEASAASDVRFGGGLDDNDRSAHTRFAPGAIIGPDIDSGFAFGAVAYEVYFDGTSGGPWLDMEPGFVGFSFLDTTGGRHYAWAELEVDNSSDPSFGSLILTRIAYETIAGIPIAAGDTGVDPPCNDADLAEPFGTLDLADITTFVAAFLAMDPVADLDGSTLFDLADITAFVTAFNAACP